MAHRYLDAFRVAGWLSRSIERGERVAWSEPPPPRTAPLISVPNQSAPSGRLPPPCGWTRYE